MDFIKRSWKGQEPLWKVFWLYGVLGGIVLGIISSVIEQVLGQLAALLFLIPYFVYIIWLYVSQWRCAFNAKWKIWGYIVRILIVLSLLGIVAGFALGFVTGFTSSFQQKFAEAKCRKELKLDLAQGGQDSGTFMQDCIRRQTGETSPVSAASENNIQPEGDTAASTLTVPATNSAPETPTPAASSPTPVSAAPGKTAEPPAPAPTPSGRISADPTAAYYKACETRMAEYAEKQGGDPQQYIAKNQDYLQKCVQYYVSKEAAKTLQGAAPAAQPDAQPATQ